MKRQVGIEEISDGRFYSRNDMVRADCNGCRGCSACCRGMGNSVVLDPMDIFRLTLGLSMSIEELLADKIELNVVDGIILPNLKMSSAGESCSFLTGEGRCSIHGLRPGICRLFPLGRFYGEQDLTVPGRKAVPEGFRYFLQVHECPYPTKTKVKVSKWVDTPDLARYERFINDWHYFLEAVQERIAESEDDTVKNINLFLLKLFYLRPYNGEEDFYLQFENRLALAKDVLAISL